MTPFLAGFADEMNKTAGVIKGLGKAVAKRPLMALGLAYPAVAAYGGYQKGRAIGQGARYLAAGRTAGGKIAPSRAAYTNFHEFLPHRAKPSEIKKLHRNYRPEAFR